MRRLAERLGRPFTQQPSARHRDTSEQWAAALECELDLALPVVVRWRKGLARLSLRVDAARRCILLHAPPHADAAQLADFVASRRGFLAERVAALPAPRPFADGVEIPIEGHMRRIRHIPGMARRVEIDNEEIRVGGPVAQLASRLARALRERARKRLLASARHHAGQLDLAPPAAVRIGDTVSRWGSCAVDGTLRFNWRLVLAPAFVLDYVAAHEVAHLRHPHHRAAFWEEVRRCRVETTTARLFLRRHGAELFAVGAER